MQSAKDIRLGFVGLRNIGMNHVKRAHALPGVTVAALADTDSRRLDAACALVGEEVAHHSTADALLAANELDAVVLSVPNHLHAPMAIAAMQQGKSVLVMKK